MLKDHGFKYTVKYYSLHIFLIAAIFILLCERPLTEFITAQIGITDGIRNETIYKCIWWGVRGFLWGFWAYIFFTDYRRKKYKYLTGRSYERDRRYGLSFGTLVDYFQDADRYKMNTNKYVVNTSWKSTEGMIFGKTKDGHTVNVPSEKNGCNAFLWGVPGSGKTAGPIIETCIRWGMRVPLDRIPKGKKPKTYGSIFCIDIKGDIYAATHRYRRIKRFSLINPEESAHFNPFAGIENLSNDDLENYIKNLGYCIVPQKIEKDTYFTETANDFWNGCCHLIFDHYGKDISFPQVIKYILEGNAVDWIRRSEASDCDLGKKYLSNKHGENEKNLSGGYSNLCKACRNFASDKLTLLLGNDPDAEYISPQMLEDGFDVYLQVKQSEILIYQSVLSMISMVFLNSFLERDQNPHAGKIIKDGEEILRPICCILDEFGQLSSLSYESIMSAFSTNRSRAVSMFCSLQSRSQLTKMYTDENATKVLVDCATHFLFLSVQDVETREWASKLIGEKKDLRLTKSVNSNGNSSTTSRSTAEVWDPIIRPADFGSLMDPDKGKDELVIYSGGKYLIADKSYYFKE